MSRDDWSEDDLAARQMDTPSWEQTGSDLDESDREELSQQLNRRQPYNGGGKTRMYREKHESGT